MKDRRQALHDFLHARSTATLADRLLDLADRDHEIYRELQQWRKLSEAPQSATDLKALVSEILAPGQGFISWRESAGYVHRAEAVLALLTQAREREPKGSVALALHALRRAWAVFQQADDSNGDIGGLCQAIGAQWVAALQAAGEQPAAFGDTYLQLLLDDPFGCFDTAAAEAAMGGLALARFRKLLADRWRQAKDAVAAAKAEHAAQVAQAAGARRRVLPHQRDSEREVRLWTLERMQLAQLEAAGDIDGALSAMREDLSEPGAFNRVTEFLERHGRHREAFANAEQGCKAFTDDNRLQEDLLRCYERDGWVEEALALRRRRFDKSPSVERYHQLLSAAEAAGRDRQALREELLQVLERREEAEAARPAAPRPYFVRTVGRADGQRDVSLRAEILCSEKRWDEAYALVQPPAYCRDALLHHIARHLDGTHHEQRVALLTRVFNSAMQDSKSPYREELQLVEEIAALLDPVRRASWLERLRAEYKAKRNFIRDLPAR